MLAPVVLEPMRADLTVHLVASAREQLREIHGAFSAWTDPLSMELHDWCESVLEGGVAEGDLSNEMWAAQGRSSLTELAYEILVNSVDRAPLVAPVYIRNNGAVLEGWMVDEFSALFGCYPVGRTPCETEPHLFAEAMVNWLSPFQVFFERPVTEYLSPLSSEALLVPETRKARATLLVSFLLKTQTTVATRNSAVAVLHERATRLEALAAERTAMMTYISTEVTRLQLTAQRSIAIYGRQLQAVDATHVAERGLMQVRLDRAKETARQQAEALRLAQEELERAEQERARLEAEAARQRQEIRNLQNRPKGGGGCSIL